MSSNDSIIPVEEEQPRHQYITRLPSSSLLSQPLLIKASTDARAFGGVDLVTLKLTSSMEDLLIPLLEHRIAALPNGVSWFVAKSCEEGATWMIVEMHLTRASNDASENASKAKQPLETAGSSGIKVLRQSSRLIETFRTTPGEGNDTLGEFLVLANPMVCEPPEVQRARMVIAPEEQNIDVVKEIKKSYLTVIRETAKTKIGQEEAFIDSCVSLQTSLPGNDAGLLAIELHQDLDASVAGRIFTVLYYFSSEMRAKSFSKSNLWKRWRRSVAVTLEGPPRHQFFQGVFDSRNLVVEATTPKSAKPVQPAVSPATLVTTLSSSIQTRLSSAPALASRSEALTVKTDVVADVWQLGVHADHLNERHARFLAKKNELLQLPVDGKPCGSYQSFASAYHHFGLRRYADEWRLTEWIPGIKAAFLMGDFNNWDRESHPLTQLSAEMFGEDVWNISLPDETSGTPLLKHKSKIKLHLITNDETHLDRIPPFSPLVWKSLEADVYDAAVWNPSPADRYAFKNSKPNKPNNPKIYEAYVGFASHQEQFGTYVEFRTSVLPHLARLGYNSLLLLGIPEHAMNTVGWHVTNFFAPSSTFGTIEEFKELIDAAHGLGIYVLMSVTHSHASLSSSAGLGEIGGGDSGFFKSGTAGKHAQWDAGLFDYQKSEICRFLLLQLSFFHEEYQIDGFRFEGVTSMLFHHHGIGHDFRDYEDVGRYFSFETDEDSIAYLMVANDFAHSLNNNQVLNVMTIAADRSRTPILTGSIDLGGLGFDFRSAPHIADEWVRQLSQPNDEQINITALVNALEHRPSFERTIAASETWSTNLRSRRPLRIAMFAWETLHTHAVGGVAPHVTELAAGLARLGHDVHVFARAVGPTYQHSVHYGVHYHECPFQLNPDFIAEMQNMCESFAAHLANTEQFMRQQFDICHAHDWLTAKTLGHMKQTGHVCVQTMHSTEFGRCGNKSYGGESKKISDIERQACHLADRIICVSGVLAEEVVQLFGVHREKIQVIYNGINACNFDGFEDAAPIKARYEIQAMEPMILFVGRMAVQKGPDLLVDAIPHVLQFRPDVKFVLVGDGHMKASLIAKAAALGVQDSCRFLGTKSGAELQSIFKASDAVVVPSRNEPFGIVVLEAWSAYKPVVATTCGGPRDFVTPNTDGLLVEPTVSSISWGCCEILKNFEHSRWMGERGRVKAAFSFSWDHIAKNTEAVYYQQLNRHDSPYCEGGLGDCSLACRLTGPSMLQEMAVFNQNETIDRGMALHKMIRLVTLGLGGEAFLNFMGNEFGHPGFLDVPRGGNGYAFRHTNRLIRLATDKQLKYKHLAFFDGCLMKLENLLEWLTARHQFVTTKDEDDNVIAFERGSCLFVFNFHPQKSFEGYQIGHSLGNNLQLILDTDNSLFGGFNRLNAGYSSPFPTLDAFRGREFSVKLYLPSRSAMVLMPEVLRSKIQKQLNKEPPHRFNGVDSFVDFLNSL